MKSEEGGRIRRRNSEEEEETMEEDKEESKSAPSGQALRYSALKALGTIDRGERRTWYEMHKAGLEPARFVGRPRKARCLDRSVNTGVDVLSRYAKG